MEITEVVKALGPIVFFGGGAYAVFKWRLGKIEKAVERMAEAGKEMSDQCVANRTACLKGVVIQISDLRDEIKTDFQDSKEDRAAMKTAIHSIDVTIARLDQKIIDRNGVWFAKSRPTEQD